MAIQNSNGLFSAPLLKSVGKLFTANVLVGIAGLLLSPVLTRLYSPADFAAFAVFMTISGFIGILATMRLEYAIILPKENPTAKSIVWLGIRFAVLISFLSGLALYLMQHFWMGFFEMPSLGNWYWLVPPTVLAMSLFQLFSHYNVRQEKFTQLATAQSISGISNPLIKIALAFQSVFSFGLMAGVSIANLLGAGGLGWRYLLDKGARSNENSMTILSKYKDFPLFNMPHALSNFFSGNLPFLLLIPVFGEYKIGLYSVAMMVVFKPISMLGNAIYQVLSQKTVTDYHAKVPLVKDVKKLLKQMIRVAILPTILLFFTAPWLFGILFGEAYVEAGKYLQCLLPWLFMVFLSTPISFVPNLFKQQRNAFIFDIIYLALRLIALWIGIYYHSFILAISLFSFVGAIMLVLYIYWIFTLLQRADKDNNV